jgi:hypothetical protein
MSDDNIDPNLGRASLIDACLANAKAAEMTAMALTENASTLRTIAEHIREQADADPLPEPRVTH